MPITLLVLPSVFGDMYALLAGRKFQTKGSTKKVSTKFYATKYFLKTEREFRN